MPARGTGRVQRIQRFNGSTHWGQQGSPLPAWVAVAPPSAMRLNAIRALQSSLPSNKHLAWPGKQINNRYKWWV